jgi:proteasome lid subunit RPN8/RPN11
MRVPQAIYDEMVRHALADAPNECCGMLGSRNGDAVTVYRAVNTAASPLKYEMDPIEILRIHNELEAAELDLGAIYHSHTRSDPYPSQTDINLAFYPDVLYLIVGVAGEQPLVRAYSIRDGDVTESELDVV